MLTAVLSSRTAYHTVHEEVSSAQTYVEGITDALGIVVWVTLAAVLPLIWVFRRKRKKTDAEETAAAGSGVSEAARAQRSRAGDGQSG